MEGNLNNYLFQIVNGIREDLINEFEKNRLNLLHNGLKGTASEKSIMENFFSERYPFLEVGAGEIISSTGFRSGQTDIILYDRKTPSFFRRGKEIQVVPIEGVIATVEVKTRLNGNDLKSSIKKSADLKRQGKTAFWNRDKSTLYKYYGETYDYFPIHTMLIAYESIEIATITKILLEEYAQLEPKLRMNYIFTLKGGLIFYDNIDNKIMLIEDPLEAMFMFYVHTYSHFSFANVPNTRIHDYGGSFNIANKIINF